MLFPLENYSNIRSKIAGLFTKNVLQRSTTLALSLRAMSHVADQIDEKDRRILGVKHEFPTATAKFISAHTKINEATVAKRLQQLIKRRILVYDVKIHDAVFPVRVVVSIDADIRAIENNDDADYPYKDLNAFAKFLRYAFLRDKKFKQLAHNVLVEDVQVLLGGRADILLSLASTDYKTLLHFVTSVLGKVPGIKSSNTAHAFSCEELSEEPPLVDSMNSSIEAMPEPEIHPSTQPTVPSTKAKDSSGPRKSLQNISQRTNRTMKQHT